jgi:hypothetical protein
MSIEEVVTAPRSQCLDYVIIFNEAHLRRVVFSYFRYYHKSRTHIAPEKRVPRDSPDISTRRWQNRHRGASRAVCTIGTSVEQPEIHLTQIAALQATPVRA